MNIEHNKALLIQANGIQDSKALSYVYSNMHYTEALTLSRNSLRMLERSFTGYRGLTCSVLRVSEAKNCGNHIFFYLYSFYWYCLSSVSSFFFYYYRLINIINPQVPLYSLFTYYFSCIRLDRLA